MAWKQLAFDTIRLTICNFQGPSLVYLKARITVTVSSMVSVPSCSMRGCQQPSLHILASPCPFNRCQTRGIKQVASYLSSLFPLLFSATSMACSCRKLQSHRNSCLCKETPETCDDLSVFTQSQMSFSKRKSAW